jgi:hypothetical protein
MTEKMDWDEVREALGYKDEPKTKIRYEDLPGKLVFPDSDPDVELLEDMKFSYLNGPPCDEVRNFTYEELELFRGMGGRVTLPVGIDFNSKIQGSLTDVDGNLRPREGQGMFTHGVILSNFVFLKEV